MEIQGNFDDWARRSKRPGGGFGPFTHDSSDIVFHRSLPGFRLTTDQPDILPASPPIRRRAAPAVPINQTYFGVASLTRQCLAFRPYRSTGHTFQPSRVFLDGANLCVFVHHDQPDILWLRSGPSREGVHPFLPMNRTYFALRGPSGYLSICSYRSTGHSPFLTDLFQSPETCPSVHNDTPSILPDRAALVSI